MDFKSNPNPMKKVNPEDLVVGQECYIKVVTEKVKISDRSPVLRDIAGNFYYPSRGEPIYTLDDQPQKPDPELEMLVNVATELMVNDSHFTEAEIEEELGHKLSEERQHGYDSKIAVLRRIASHQVRTVKPTGWVWR